MGVIRRSRCSRPLWVFPAAAFLALVISSGVWAEEPSGCTGGEAGKILEAPPTTTVRSGTQPFLLPPGTHPSYSNPYVFMITPELADDMASSGYTQESLRNSIYDSARVPYEELSTHERKTIQARIDQSIAGGGIFSDQLPADRVPVWEKGLKPGGKVPILVTPEDLHFVVAGAAQGKSITGWSYLRAPYTWSSHRTIRIKGATLTKAGS